MTSNKLSMKDRPLKAFVSRGVLTIEIGVDTLAFAALRSDYAYSLMGPKQERPDTRFGIRDKRAFAREVVCELHREAEDGSSLLTKLFDDACQGAIEDGSTEFVDRDDDTYPPIVRTIGSCAFCDNGAMIHLDEIAVALAEDRKAGFRDPTPDEVLLLVQGGDDEEPPAELRAQHPALDALLTREMT